MLRAIKNITLLVLICFIASGIPLYLDKLSVPTSFGIISSQLLLDVQPIQKSPTQWDIDVTFSTNNKAIPIALNFNNPFTIDLYHDEVHIKSLNPKELISNPPNLSTETIEITKDNPLAFQFSIKQDKIDIPDGNYRLKIKSNIINEDQSISPFDVAINFQSDYTYIPSLQSIKSNETALLLHFPSAEYNHLIPITRIIPYTKTPLKSVLVQLQKGPFSELGLPVTSPIPTNVRLKLNKEIANVYLPSEIGKYNNNATDAFSALGSFVNTLTAIDGVKGVQFYFNRKIVETAFHGEIVSEPLYSSNATKIYIGTITPTKRVLLTPIDLTGKETTVENIFQKMKYSGSPEIYHYQIQPPIPDSVELMSSKLQNGILTLELNDGFLEAYSDHKDKQAFMLEAMLYSFTSHPDIEGIIFQVNETPVTSFGGLQFPIPAIPSKYINPEK